MGGAKVAWGLCYSWEDYRFSNYTWDYYLEDGTIAVWFTEDWEIYSPGAGSPMGIFSPYNQTQAMLGWFNSFVSWSHHSAYASRQNVSLLFAPRDISRNHEWSSPL